MTPQEKQLIDGLFERLSQNASGQRDPEAERYIAERIAALPGAAYYLAQTVVVQAQTLKTAESQIEQLKRDAEAARSAAANAPGAFGQSSFGQGSFGQGSFGQGSPAGALAAGTPGPRAAPPQSEPVYDAPPRYQGAPAAASSVPSFGRPPSAVGGFLANAGQIALGVAGGALMADAVRSMFGGGGGLFGGGANPTEVVNITETDSNNTTETNNNDPGNASDPAAASPWGDAGQGGNDPGAGVQDAGYQDAGYQDAGNQGGGFFDNWFGGGQDSGQDAGQDPGFGDGFDDGGGFDDGSSNA